MKLQLKLLINCQNNIKTIDILMGQLPNSVKFSSRVSELSTKTLFTRIKLWIHWLLLKIQNYSFPLSSLAAL